MHYTDYALYDNMHYTDASWFDMVGLTILHLHGGVEAYPYKPFRFPHLRKYTVHVTSHPILYNKAGFVVDNFAHL